MRRSLLVLTLYGAAVLVAQVAAPVSIVIQVVVPLLFFLPTRAKTEEAP